MNGDLLFGPGLPITVCRPYVELILDAIGREVDRGLTWDWPAPYDGEQRRAAVRIREKVAVYERLVLGEWSRQIADLAIYGTAFWKAGRRVDPLEVTA